MPAQYEAIKRSYLKRGLSLKKSKELAARTYLKQNPGKGSLLHHGKRKSRKLSRY